jgi:hypothetical protein
MKALTLMQSWATLAAIGAKKIETRSWSTKYRGEIALHAAKGFPRWAKELCFTDPFYSTLEQIFPNDSIIESLPLGCVLAKFNLVNVVKIEFYNRVASLVGSDYYLINGGYTITPQEFAFGDYTPGRYMWLMQDMTPLPEPIPARGALQLWEWKEPNE